MKKICVVALILICSSGCGEHGGEVEAGGAGDYLGEQAPGATPRLFGSGVLSTDLNELNCAFAPD